MRPSQLTSGRTANGLVAYGSPGSRSVALDACGSGYGGLARVSGLSCRFVACLAVAGNGGRSPRYFGFWRRGHRGVSQASLGQPRWAEAETVKLSATASACAAGGA
jgi:hypothetical protein